MGPLGSPYSRYGVQITDSEYVVVNMRIMTRMGENVLPYIKKNGFVKCMHTVGDPLKNGKPESKWPCNPDVKYISHFPDERMIISYGSGYGGNALMGKKCFALRIAYLFGKRRRLAGRTHAYHMGVESPNRKKKLRSSGFPECLRKNKFCHAYPTKRI